MLTEEDYIPSNKKWNDVVDYSEEESGSSVNEDETRNQNDNKSEN
jgi:hypothetical protein